MTREEAIKVLENTPIAPMDGYSFNDISDALYMAVEALQTPPISQRSMYQAGYRQALKDRPKGEWIPVSERLPRARESVLLAVNHKYGNWVGEGCYWETTDNHIIWKGYRWNATYWDDEIIAWMPLPKPYREDGELNV